MDLSSVINAAGNGVYLLQAGMAVWGVYAVFFTLRQIGRRAFSSDRESETFLDTLRNLMEGGEYDRAGQLCDEPAHVYRALPILSKSAMLKRHLSPAKLREMLAAKFERDILNSIENQRSTINTVAKSAPMLGLLGTVAGMIAAFAKIGGAERVNPQSLAGDISLALITTAVGLLIAIPMILALNIIEVRTRSLEDSVVEGLQTVLDDLEAVDGV